MECWLLEHALKRYKGAEIVLDPWQAEWLVQRLRDRGARATKFAFTAESASQLALTLHSLLRERALVLPDDEELLTELESVRLLETGSGRFRLDHDSTRHDDQAVALALAAHTILSRPERGPRMRALIA